MLLSVKKLVNSKTGEVKYQLTQLRPVQYEFDFEALADFKYSIGEGDLTNRKQEARLIKSIEKKQAAPERFGFEEVIEYMQPNHFTRGKNIYAQVKDNQVNLDFLSKTSLINKTHS